MKLYEIMIAITWWFVMLWGSRLFVVGFVARQIGQAKNDLINKFKGEGNDDTNTDQV